MGFHIKRSNPNFIKTSTVVKLNPYLSFFTKPFYLQLSTIAAAVQVMANAYLTLKNICEAHPAKTTMVAVQHCLSFVFCFEVVISVLFVFIQVVIISHNHRKPIRLRLNPRVPFSWFELLLLLSNIATGIIISLELCPSSLWLGFPFLICALSAGRLIRRVNYFKRAVSIIWNSALSLLTSSIFMIQFVLVFSTIVSDLFNSSLLACDKTGYQDSPLNPTECTQEGGQMSPYFINYNHIWNALFACYTVLDKSQWFMITDLVTLNWNGSPLYNLWHHVMVVIAVSIISLIFRATTISLCYINLGAFSLVNIDKTITLSEQQREWVQIEEQLASLQLLRKKEKSFHYIVVICRRICNSRIFKFIYNFILIGGFVLNLAA